MKEVLRNQKKIQSINKIFCLINKGFLKEAWDSHH